MGQTLPACNAACILDSVDLQSNNDYGSHATKVCEPPKVTFLKQISVLLIILKCVVQLVNYVAQKIWGIIEEKNQKTPKH